MYEIESTPEELSVEAEEDTPSVGDNSLKSSRPTPTIDEILGIDRP
jgi:hypothetical protein